jgi:hypothetical protein
MANGNASSKISFRTHRGISSERRKTIDEVIGYATAALRAKFDS